MQKTILQEHYNCSEQRTPQHKTKYSANENILKISHLAKAIAHAKATYSLCKMVSLGQKIKSQKHAKKHSTSTLELFCAKNRSKKKNKSSRNEKICF